jgi:hypothetical protein
VIVMLYLIDIKWKRRAPQPGEEPTGTTTQAEFARSSRAAINKAGRKFRQHYGAHRLIQSVSEQAEPATTQHERIDCGSGQDYGICQICGKGHGIAIMQDGLASASLA